MLLVIHFRDFTLNSTVLYFITNSTTFIRATSMDRPPRKKRAPYREPISLAASALTLPSKVIDTSQIDPAFLEITPDSTNPPRSPLNIDLPPESPPWASPSPDIDPFDTIDVNID